MKKHLITGAAYVVIIGGIFGLLVWAVPTVEDRFDRCMALAERAGLLEARREEVALLCLHNVTRRRSSDRDGPVVIPSPTGGPPTVIP